MAFSTPREQLKLLILAPFAPRMDAPHGGGRVLAQFLEKICIRHQVALLYLRDCNEAAVDNFFREHCAITEEVVRPWSRRSPIHQLFRNSRLMASLAIRTPMWVADWDSKRFVERVRSIAAAWHPDIVQIETHVMAQYLPALEGCPAPRVLIEYEPGILSAPYLKKGPAGFRQFTHRLDLTSWAHFEQAAIRQVQAVVTFTEKDQKALSSYGISAPVITIPIGTPIPERPLDPYGSSPSSLLLVGNFLHPPNIEAALRLSRNIFPELQKKFPELRLYIVGPEPPLELKQFASESVIITGWVENLTPYYDRAAVFVAPFHMGGGMRVKVLEAMAAGKAIVATPLAMEGLDVKDGAEFFMGESDGDIIERISQLLAFPDLRARLAGRARAWACENLSWNKSIVAYEQLYQSLLKGKRD